MVSKIFAVTLATALILINYGYSSKPTKLYSESFNLRSKRALDPSVCGAGCPDIGRALPFYAPDFVDAKFTLTYGTDPCKTVTFECKANTKDSLVLVNIQLPNGDSGQFGDGDGSVPVTGTFDCNNAGVWLMNGQDEVGNANELLLSCETTSFNSPCDPITQEFSKDISVDLPGNEANEFTPTKGTSTKTESPVDADGVVGTTTLTCKGSVNPDNNMVLLAQTTDGTYISLAYGPYEHSATITCTGGSLFSPSNVELTGVFICDELVPAIITTTTPDPLATTIKLAAPCQECLPPIEGEIQTPGTTKGVFTFVSQPNPTTGCLEFVLTCAADQTSETALLMAKKPDGTYLDLKFGAYSNVATVYCDAGGTFVTSLTGGIPLEGTFVCEEELKTTTPVPITTTKDCGGCAPLVDGASTATPIPGITFKPIVATYTCESALVTCEAIDDTFISTLVADETSGSKMVN
uniref:C6 domain-containing protein n=1 Tax=Rhabditophanes sp. KR3021 TaxID=114890 RepID=A0AC35UCR7_9BILA